MVKNKLKYRPIGSERRRLESDEDDDQIEECLLKVLKVILAIFIIISCIYVFTQYRDYLSRDYIVSMFVPKVSPESLNRLKEEDHIRQQISNPQKNTEKGVGLRSHQSFIWKPSPPHQSSYLKELKNRAQQQEDQKFGDKQTGYREHEPVIENKKQEEKLQVKKEEKHKEEAKKEEEKKEEEKKVQQQPGALKSFVKKQYKTVIYLRQEPDENNEISCPAGERGIKIIDVNEVTATYRDIEKAKPYPELPICLLVTDPQGQHVADIQASVSAQKYSNYKAVYLTKSPPLQTGTFETVANYSYFAFKQAIDRNCQPNALVFVASNPLAPNALATLNDLHQSYSAWISYSLEGGAFEVHAFYRRIFDLVEHNDFKATTQQFLGTEREGVIALSMLELSQQHKKKIPSNKLFSDGKNNHSPMFVKEKSCIVSQREQYQPLFSLSQGYQVNVSNLEVSFKKFNENHDKHYNGYYAYADRGITQDKGFKAIENQELVFLPKEHSLAVRESRYYDELYNISKYKDKELPLCISVMSHNNVEQERYQRVMQSILSQDYSNYHIVFLDDNSDDGTLQKTKEFMDQMGFPRDRINYIYNLERKFATYNIVHAAHSYCREEDIQILLDGDDEFIGKHMLQLYNGLYQQNSNLWLIYSTYISNFFTYGESKHILHRLDGPGNTRKIGHFIGPTRSWYVKLIRQIPLEYHRFKNGTWLDTMYDDALQYSFYELATEQRIRYFPEFTYMYNSNYGQNDNSSEQKVNHRKLAHKELTSYERLKALQTLKQQFPPNQKILDLFNSEKDIKFKEVKS